MSGNITISEPPPSTERDQAREPVVMELGTGWVRWAYEATMIALAVTVAVLLLVPDSGWARAVNLAIWGVFVVDYAVRLWLSTDRRGFVKRNIPDLIAILPLDFFRIARLARLARLTRLLRAGTVLWRVTRDLRGVLKTNGLGWLLIVTTTVVFIGGLAAWLVEPELASFGDALWWSVVTATTVGYGDIAPASTLARIVAVILMLIGIGTLGMITGSIATYFVGGRGQNSPSDPDVARLLEELSEWDQLTVPERRRKAAMLSALIDIGEQDQRQG